MAANQLWAAGVGLLARGKHQHQLTQTAIPVGNLARHLWMVLLAALPAHLAAIVVVEPLWGLLGQAALAAVLSPL